MNTSLSFEVVIQDSYEAALTRVTEALKQEGFGVLTSIDVKATMKEKLGADFQRYTILGACNPQLAHRSLSHNIEVGLMLPCNVTVEETSAGEITVRIIDPLVLIRSAGMGEDAVLMEIAAEAHSRLSDVAARLAEKAPVH